MICDKLVFGIKDDATKQKLLSREDLQLKQAIDKCTGCGSIKITDSDDGNTEQGGQFDQKSKSTST